MDERGGSRTAGENRASMRTSILLSSVGDEDNENIPVIISPSPDSTGPTTDSTSQNGGLLAPSNLTSPDDNTLQRPNSVHSRPSSIAKPHAQGVPPPRTDAISPELGLRGTSDNPVQAEAPYEGPSNPSHPYQMYPQRAMSISTISTTPGPEASYSGSRGPTHPYGLYPQITPTIDSQPGSVPVGFPGMTNAYPRRVAPGGDEITSFTGSLTHSHLEELPPYTRYPDNAPAPKVEDSQPTTEAQPTGEARPGPASQVTPLAAIPAIPGAGGIGLATRDPEFGSTSSDVGSPRLSTRSFTSDDDSHHEINTAARTVVNEKPERKSWQQKATRKLWGIIPFWAVGLLGIALIVMGVILGAVIGTFLSKHPKGPKGGKPFRPPAPELNGTQEVILLESVPEDLPDLEVGTWGLLPLVIGQAPSTCFEKPDQSQAWTCNTPFNLLSLDLQTTDDEPPTSAYQLKFTIFKDSLGFAKYAWGARSPSIPEHQTLRLVSDPADPGLGPAWWVRVAYNKTVILPEDRLSNQTEVSRRRRRDLSLDGSSVSEEGDGAQEAEDAAENEDPNKKKGQPFPVPGAQDGDRPWICTWPDTVLEMFVYPRQNNTFNTHAATASFSSWPGFPTPTSTSTSVGEALTAEVIPTGTPSVPAESPSAVPSGTSSAPPWTMPKFPPLPPPFPKIVKVTERRTGASADSVVYCEQVEIIDGGTNHRPHLDEKGRPIRIAVPERGGSSQSPSSNLVIRETPPSECGCVWMVE
ncbi:uncharacterized protein DNG_05334 [Cephalotrichum gorgonifer]|uniref:DUF7820 domain-containing protein n=1 Tax=Cephalotrichum gorgonifer TaxID=2041049 RepID=A0AAE8MXQ3_9PEZI|nr:uncharacterized protein DNG_05334 [Cephalotrichum gorgonifer]